MVVSTPVTLPSEPGYQETVIRPERVVGDNRSDFTLRQRVHDFGGHIWRATFQLPPLIRVSPSDSKANFRAQRWVTRLQKLQGKNREFEEYPRHAPEPRGSVSSSISVDSSNSANDQITITGFTADKSGVLLEGDFLEAGGELVKVVNSSVDADSNGEADVDVDPGFRSDPSGETITYSKPTITWRLTTNNPEWTISKIVYLGIVIDAVESF